MSFPGGLRTFVWVPEHWGILDAAGSIPKANVCSNCMQRCPQWGTTPITVLPSELTGSLGQEVCKAHKHPKFPWCTPLAPACQLEGPRNGLRDPIWEPPL